MMSVSTCPSCARPLQAFRVRAPSGSELELGRCNACGGCWGARGRIQETFGPSARHQLIGGMTTRSCVECRILMTPAMLPSDLAVEVCSACHGMFLDAGELARLGVREPGGSPASTSPRPPALPRRAAPPPARAVPPPPPSEALEPPTEEDAPPAKTSGTFECIECGKRKPLREGQGLRDGLACRDCMKARVEGGDGEELGLGRLFGGRPRR